MANNLMADNAGLETAGIGVAADVVESTAETEVVPDATQAVATTEKPEVSQTKAFSERLKAERARLDAEADADIAAAGMIDPLSGTPIKTRADLAAFNKRQKTTQEAREKGVDPAVYGELNALKEQLEGLKHETTIAKQDEALSKDPKFGEIYKANREAIKELAQKIPGLDLESASMLFVRNNLDQIVKQASQKASNETLAKTTAAKAASPGSLSGGGDAPTNDIASMSKSDFEALVKKAENGELRKT